MAKWTSWKKMHGGNTRLPPARTSGRGTSSFLGDRKSTRLNSSHSQSSYAGFCLKKERQWSAAFRAAGSAPAPAERSIRRLTAQVADGLKLGGAATPDASP